MTDQDVYQLIKSRELAIKEDLLITSELTEIKNNIELFLDEKLNIKTLLFLKYRKFKAPGGSVRMLLTDANGYPIQGYNWIKPWLDFFEEYLGEKTIKRHLKTDETWVESRLQGEDEHIFVGSRNNASQKAHIIIDGKTGEIRVDDKDTPPEEIIKHIKTTLTLKNGAKINSTREGLELIDEDEVWSGASISVSRVLFKGYDVILIYNSGQEDVENFKMTLFWNQAEGNQSRVQEHFLNENEDPLFARYSTLSLLCRGERKYAINIPSPEAVSDLVVQIECTELQTSRPYKLVKKL